MSMGAPYRLCIEIVDTAAPEQATGLLIPLPPTTRHQRLEDFNVNFGADRLVLVDQSTRQSALYVAWTGSDRLSPIELRVHDSGELVANHFDAAPLCHEPDVAALGQELHLLDMPLVSSRLERIVAHLASRFTYRSGHVNDAPLTCDALTGNCQSINEALMKLAAWAGVPCAYYIGYFCDRADRWATDDWHCWVSTHTERGTQDWDISHQIKRALTPVGPGLNPVQGLRFAMGVGRDLRFETPGATVCLPHFCEPRWILRDGRTRRCAVRVQAAHPALASHAAMA